MKRSTWPGILAFGIAVGFIGSGTLVMVLALSTPTAAKGLVFAGGFFGTLLLGTLIPRVRRGVLSVSFQAVAARPEQVAAPERSRTLAPETLLNQNALKKTPKPRRNSLLKRTRHRTHTQEQSAKRLEQE